MSLLLHSNPIPLFKLLRSFLWDPLTGVPASCWLHPPPPLPVRGRESRSVRTSEQASKYDLRAFISCSSVCYSLQLAFFSEGQSPPFLFPSNACCPSSACVVVLIRLYVYISRLLSTTTISQMTKFVLTNSEFYLFLF